MQRSNQEGNTRAEARCTEREEGERGEPEATNGEGREEGEEVRDNERLHRDSGEIQGSELEVAQERQDARGFHHGAVEQIQK